MNGLLKSNTKALPEMLGLDGDLRTLKDAGKGGGVKRLDEIGLQGRPVLV